MSFRPAPDRSRLIARLAPLALACLVVAVLAPVASQAAPPVRYVALGDSYSSGTGTREYIDDGTSCQRSVYAYPSLLAAQRDYRLDFRACSGARVADVRNNQVDALGRNTSHVTVSVGGNDAGFAAVLTECAQPWWMSDCDGAIDEAQAFIRNTLPGRLATLYAAIDDRASNAGVVVVGYPRIFMGEDCNAGTWFSPEEQARLNETADLLNEKTSGVAGAQGFGFADPTRPFIGHAVCDDPEWINGLSNPVSESYHPNRLGHADGYTPLVGQTLTGSTQTVTSQTRAAARASADDLAAQQRRYAGRDASITPEAFEAPDLTTPQARRAAERAGIDLDRWLARHPGH